MDGRSQYQRPQAMLWSLTAPNTTIQSSTGLLIPDGIEFGANSLSTPSFLILTDDNRGVIDFDADRIEQRQRMINGRMRSFHIADKKKLSSSWDMIPSRSFIGDPLFNTSTGNPNAAYTSSYGQYTTDGGAGGNEMLDWYENNTGPFYVYLAYDKYPDHIKTATVNKLSAESGVSTYTTTTGHKFQVGDVVMIDGLVIIVSGSPLAKVNGLFTITSIPAADKFTVSNPDVTTSGSTITATTNGSAKSRTTFAQYNEVLEMYISNFSYSVQRRGGSNYDFWNISVGLEEV